MKHLRRKRTKSPGRGRQAGRGLLERWRRSRANVTVELTRPRVIDVVPIDFLRGEPSQPATAQEPTRKFRARLIYFTADDVTFRRPSGAILVVDNYEITSLSDGKHRFEPGRTRQNRRTRL